MPAPLKRWCIRELLATTSRYLKAKGIDSPRLTAELLLAHALGVRRLDLYLNPDQPLTPPELDAYRSLLTRRLRREPLQHITGVQEFWSSEFRVTPAVLIPRPETELLVEQAIRKLEATPQPEDLRVLDLGTGAGVLAVCLAAHFPRARLWATDISEAALEVARLNALRHGVSERIVFLQGDLWAPLRNRGLSFHLIVSNPPYVESEVFSTLAPEIRDHEPRTALDGGPGGMHLIERILQGAPEFLEPMGWLLLETAPHQNAAALDRLSRHPAYGTCGRLQDYSRRDRVVFARKTRAATPPPPA